MSALYVTVSLPLLLVLAGAGFNNAYGLITFGKSSNNQNGPLPVQGKPCNFQANCTLIKGTTCIKNYCLCGDNTHPVNGLCSAQQKGPKHMCTTDEECVEGATCLPLTDKTKSNGSTMDKGDYKFCQCGEGYVETSTICSGATKLRFSSGGVLPLLAVCMVVLSMYQKI